MDSAEGGLRLEATPSGVAVFLKGRSLTGPDPSASSRRRLPLHTESQTLYVVFSPVLGYGLPEFFKRLEPATAVLLVELDPSLGALRDHEHSQIPDPLPLAVRYASSRFDALKTAETLVNGHAIRRLHRIHLTGGSRLHAREYEELARVIEERIHRFWANRGAEVRLGRRWIANLMRNTLLDALPLSSAGLALSSSVILVGAGPNLDRNVGELRRLFASSHRTHPPVPGSVSLAALDTALPALAEAGLRPDLVFSMDGQLANAYDLMPWRWDLTTLIADITVHPSIARRFPANRRAFFASRFSETVTFLHGPLLADIPQVAPRGSVAPAALEILVTRLGVRRVVTIGVDFWYRLPRTHAAMTGPDRRFRRTMDRLSRRDGFEELLFRPGRKNVLRDGTSSWCDGVLEDQAGQMRYLAEDLLLRYPDLQVQTPDAAGLPTGAALCEDALQWIAKGAASAVPLSSAAKSVADGQVPPGSGERRKALMHVLERLRAQERSLDRHPDGGDSPVPVVLDADLDFVLLDMPQWPLILLRREWANAHHGRILRSVRDYRRRAERALLAATRPVAGAPDQLIPPATP